MKVLAYCLKTIGIPVNIGLPAIPNGLVSDAGFVWKGERLVDGEFVTCELKEPIEVPDDGWLGVEADGSCVALAHAEEAEWSIPRAAKLLEEAKAPISASAEKALRSVTALHAAAALMGVRVSKLHEGLQKVQKSPTEPLEVTVRALVGELAKQQQTRVQ